MDKDAAILILSEGNAVMERQIRELLAHNQRFDDILSEYMETGAVLSGAQRSATRDYAFEEQYRGLMAERAMELHDIIVESASAAGPGQSPIRLSYTIGDEEKE